jgi:hypothetical protein
MVAIRKNDVVHMIGIIIRTESKKLIGISTSRNT